MQKTRIRGLLLNRVFSWQQLRCKGWILLGIQPFVVWEGEDGQPETFAKPATHGAAACRCCQPVKPC